MKTEMRSTENHSISSRVQRLSLERPILVIVILFLIALFFRWIDAFVFRLDEILGELILTKSLGFILVLAFLWLTKHKLKDIGLHSTHLRPALTIGIGVTAAAFICGYGVDIWIAFLQGNQPVLEVGAIDSKMGVTGGALFALWLLFGNCVNAFMEEGLFRGVICRLARIRFDFWKTNWFQAAFFSAWHIPWVFKYYQIGEIETTGEILTSILFHTVPQLLIGLVYGYYYLKTDSLWLPWVVHALNNTILNFLHVRTVEGLDTGIPVRMGVYLVVIFLSLLWVRVQAEKHQMPEVKAWG